MDNQGEKRSTGRRRRDRRALARNLTAIDPNGKWRDHDEEVAWSVNERFDRLFDLAKGH